MRWLVSVHESVIPAAVDHVFYGIAFDVKGDGWSVRVQLLDPTVDDRWASKIQFLVPEAEQALGEEFDIWNGSRQHGRCIAEVRRVPLKD